MNEKSDYMLLFRGTNWSEGLSPDKLQKVVSDWMAWFDGLKQDGRVLSGHPLKNESKIVSGLKGATMSDGPFAESKEAVGGYFYLRVADMDEAVAIARNCPGLEYGAMVEVHPVADICGVFEQAQQAAKTALVEV